MKPIIISILLVLSAMVLGLSSCNTAETRDTGQSTVETPCLASQREEWATGYMSPFLLSPGIAIHPN